MEPKKQPLGWKGCLAFVLAIGVTIAVCVMTTMMLAVGRSGEVDRSLAILSVDMGNFAKFQPPWIEITDKAQPKRDETFKLISVRGLLDGKLGEIAEDTRDYVDDAAEKVGESTGDSVKDTKKKGQQAIDDFGKKAGGFVDEIGDKIDDVEEILKKVFEKVLGKIEHELNEWLQSVAKALAGLDIAQGYSLHVTTYCKVPRVFSSEKDDTSNYTIGPAECTQFFGGANKDEKFDAVENKGEILGFSPANLTASVMGLFLIPAEVQAKVKEPINEGANKTQSALLDAQNTFKKSLVQIAVLPTVIFYATACGLAWIMLLVLLLHLGRTLLSRFRPDSAWLPPLKMVPYDVIYKSVPLMAAFCLLLGAMTITVVHFLAKVINTAAGVVKISVQSGGTFVAMSWVSFLLLVSLIVVARRLPKPSSSEGCGKAADREDDQGGLRLKPWRWGRRKPNYPSPTPPPQRPEFPKCLNN